MRPMTVRGDPADARAAADGPAAAPRITRIQTLALASAFLGWMFDSMDLNIFTLVLVPSISELTGRTDPADIARIGGYVLAIKLFAWGLGGIVFGVAADRYGRARIMAITVVVYSVFTGCSALAQSWPQLALFQALAGLGIGGEWAAGAALVAETWPTRHRAKAIQVMQMAFAFGFFAAALANLLLGGLGWRWVVAVGAAPALLTILIRRYVPEPERWTRVRQDKAPGGSAFAELAFIFGGAWRRRTLVGVVVASAAMIGCWGGLTLLPNWIQQLTPRPGDLTARDAISYAFMLMMAGATLGYLTLAWLSDFLGRRVCYFVFWSGAFVASWTLFHELRDIHAVLRFMPVYGYFVIGGFGTFATYLPELFPTRVRATGQGFCWNMARMLTGFGPLAVGPLLKEFGTFPAVATFTSLFFVVGLVAIWLGPETKGTALQD